MVPQVGTHRGVTLPHNFPSHELLDGLEPLGWIHTQPNETPMTASDVTTHAKRVVSPESGWNPSDAACIACSFTPGSCSLTAYTVTAEGILFGKGNTDMSPNPEGFDPSFAQRAQLLLSDRILGYFLVPAADSGCWNYNFNGIKFDAKADYALRPGVPLEFYHEIHRPMHFFTFADDEDNYKDQMNFLEDPCG